MAVALHAEIENDPATRPVLGLAPALSPDALMRYEAEPTRCVIEAVLRNRGLALWRVRLRPIAVALSLPETPDADSTGKLTAQISSRPRFASLPGTLGLFLPDTPREQRISLSALALPTTLDDGTTSTSTAEVTLGERVWQVELTVSIVHNDGDRIVAAITGELPRTQPIPFGRCAMHIDAAIEFRRWA